jgi:TrmH family RNA methyltransferase
MALISSISNPRVQSARKLHRRRERLDTRRFLIEGPKAVNDALESDWPLVEIFVEGDHPEIVAACRERDIPVIEVSESVMRAVSDAITPQGVVAVGKVTSPPGWDRRPGTGLRLVLGEIRDPGNAGTLIRSAAAAGCDLVTFTKGSVDPWSPKVVRSAAGATFRVATAIEVDLPEAISQLKGLGYRVVGADARAGTDLYEADLGAPLLAIVLGNESWGMPSDVSGSLDELVAIDMPGGAESLNVGVAGSVILFEALRQRR